MFNNILVATDGSSHANKAIDLAGDLATKYNANLTILTVLEGGPLTEDGKRLAREKGINLQPDINMAPLTPISPEGGPILHDAKETLETAHIEAELAEAIIEDAKERATTAGAGKVKVLSQTGNAAEAILGAADSQGVDLIVIGSRGMGALKGLLVGSVSQKVSHLANCTCITVK
jgi:nucleotide-binding universal stress UspA family protein